MSLTGDGEEIVMMVYSMRKKARAWWGLRSMKAGGRS